MRTLLSLACILFAGSSSVAGAQADVEVELVEVPVRVTKQGQPVRGLDESAFDLRVNGRPVSIFSFEEFSLGSSATPSERRAAQQTPVAARGSLLLFFDRALTEETLIDQARSAALDLVLNLQSAGTMVGVGTYDGRGVNLLIPFTTDRRQVVRALTRLEPQLAAPAEDPLGLVISAPEDAQLAFEQAKQTSSTTPRAARSGGRSRVDLSQETGELTQFFRSLSGLAERLDSLPGNKQVVLFSRGPSDDLLFGGGRADGSRFAFERSRDAGYDPSRVYGDQTLQGLLRELTEAFVSADCVVDAVDLGSVGSSSPTGTDALRRIARDTGGTLLARQSLGDAVNALRGRAEHSYLLTFDPSVLGELEPGKLLSIAVSIDDAAKGATVTHRRGYRGGIETADTLVLARRAIGDRAGGSVGTQLRTLPAREPLSSGKRVVPLVLEIEGPQLMAKVSGTALDLEIYGYAVRDDGTILDHFAQKLSLDTRAVGGKLGKGGLLFLGTFTTPPGRYTARILTRAAGGRLSSLALDSFEVSEEPTSTQQLLFPAGVQDWVLAPGRGASEVADSFMVADTGRPTAATLRPEVPGPGMLFVAGPGFDKATLIDAEGATRDLVISDREENPSGTLRFAVTFPALPAGAYTLILSNQSNPQSKPAAAQVIIDG